MALGVKTRREEAAHKPEENERAKELEKTESVQIVGFDISIKEWIIILLKLNVAVACIMIPVFIIFTILMNAP